MEVIMSLSELPKHWRCYFSPTHHILDRWKEHQLLDLFLLKGTFIKRVSLRCSVVHPRKLHPLASWEEVFTTALWYPEVFFLLLDLRMKAPSIPLMLVMFLASLPAGFCDTDLQDGNHYEPGFWNSLLLFLSFRLGSLRSYSLSILKVIRHTNMFDGKPFICHTQCSSNNIVLYK